MNMYILPPFMDEVLSEEIVKKDNWWNGWEYSRWEFSGWEFSGGEFSRGETMSETSPKKIIINDGRFLISVMDAPM